MKLTKWIDGSEYPVRVGVYEAQFRRLGPAFYFNWNGKRWSTASGDPAGAATRPVGASNSPFRWRGLAEKP